MTLINPLTALHRFGALWANTVDNSNELLFSPDDISEYVNTRNGFINVKDFGAIGDGARDDRAAIHSADVAGTQVFFPTGVYRVGSNLTISASCVFAPNAILKPDAGVTVTLSAPLAVLGERYQCINMSNSNALVVVAKNTDVCPEWWGVTGDNVTDDGPFFRAMGLSLKASPARGVTIHFMPHGTYQSSDSNFLIGLPRYVLEGHGATWTYTGADYDFKTGGDFFTDRNPDGSATGTSSFGDTIATVAAGVSVVVCTTVARAANYAAGSWVLVHGYSQYRGGFPPAVRWFEWAKVVSNDPATGHITLDRRLRFSYRSDWPADADYTAGGYTVGPACVLSLSRTHYTLNESGIVRDLTITGTSGFGGAYAAGLDMRLERCTTRTFTPSSARSILIDHCELTDSCEVDKVIGLFEAIDCDAKTYDAASGADRVRIRGGIIRDGGTLAGRIVEYEGVSMSNIDPAVSGLISGSGLWPCFLVRARGCEFNPHAATQRLVAGGQTASFTVGTVVNATTVTIPNNSTNLSALDALIEGFRIYTDAGNTARVTALYLSGVNLVIEATFATTPVIGDVFSWHTVQRMDVEMSPVRGVAVSQTTSFERAEEFSYRPNNAAMTERVFTFAPVTGAAQLTWLPGFVRRVLVNVVTPYSGADATAEFYVDSQAPVGTRFAQINLKIAGIREVNGTAGLNAQVGDVLTPTAYLNTQRFNLFGTVNTGTDVQKAKVMVMIETVPFL